MDAVNIFTSKVRKELLRLFFGNSENRYYVRELERMLHIPASMVSRELIKLKAAGILNYKAEAKVIYYFINKNYPLYEEFKSIVSKTIGLKAILTAALEKVENIELAFIYGSYARNEENVNSDIDIFILGEPEEEKLVKGIMEAEKMLKREINYTVYSRKDLIKKIKEMSGFILDILKNNKIYLKGEENDIKRISGKETGRRAHKEAST